ncbi:hypothetical protein C8J57DRAFT_579941 [Mycena rebaudengoi]|nr:hypothetical protein C8J57DRAFT_579941 [Mycena rebaudengoi]
MGEVMSSKRWEYYVKWANFPDEDNTWEPISSLKLCRRLLKRFWSEAGHETFDIDLPDFVVEPREQWITDEKLRFASKNALLIRSKSQSPCKKPKKHQSPPSTPTPSAKFPRKNTQQHNTWREEPLHDSDSEPDDTRPSFKIKIPAFRKVSPRADSPHDSLFSPEPEVGMAYGLPSPSPSPSPPPGPRSTKGYDPPGLSSGSELLAKRVHGMRPLPFLMLTPSVHPNPVENDGPTLVPDNSTAKVAATVSEQFLGSSMQHGENEDDADGPQTGFDNPPDHSARLDTGDNDDPMDFCNFGDLGIGGDDFDSTKAPGPDLQQDPVDSFTTCKPGPEPPIPTSTEWTWSGRLVNAPTGEEFCSNANIVESMVTKRNIVGLGAFIVSKRDLQLSKVYNIDDILLVLPACEPAHHFARLVSHSDDGSRFMKYMAKKEQVLLLPANLDGDIVGYILLFPPSMDRLSTRLQVPDDIRKPDGLVVSLVLWNRKALPDHRRNFPRFEAKPPPAELSVEVWKASIRQEPEFHIGLEVLKLPAAVYSYALDHPSLIWYQLTSDGILDKDTRYLLCVLQKSKARVVEHTDMSVDLIFIHVNAVKTIHNMPGLAQRRRRSDVLFFTYGTDVSVPRERWGFREIFPCGGVVTFTPEALFFEPWSVVKTLRNLRAHPQWEAYLLPQVLGRATRLPFDFPEAPAFPFAFNYILEAIEDGTLALIHAPSNDQHSGIIEWVREHWVRRPRGAQEVLEYCDKSFETAYPAPISHADLTDLVKNDILSDLRRMQVQPAIVDTYRRFVVLDAGSGPETWHEGVEWLTVGSFDFVDNRTQAAA